VVTVFATARIALWLTTDLVYRHRVDAIGVPVYGPWMEAVTMPIVLLVRHGQASFGAR
jgi:hypothetical protein